LGNYLSIRKDAAKNPAGIKNKSFLKKPDKTSCAFLKTAYIVVKGSTKQAQPIGVEAMTATETMKATKGQTSTHLHYVTKYGTIAETETIRNRRALGRRLRELEEVGGIFTVGEYSTITVK
jgi:hypothetical protein